jgi:hypothetical protein
MGTNDAVCVELKGGLGNQLFQYAAGRALSLRLSCRLVLDITAFDAPPEHITQRSFMLDRFASGAETMPALEDLAWSDYVQPSYTFDPAFNDLGRGTRLRGYFQSELFFASARETRRRQLRSIPSRTLCRSMFGGGTSSLIRPPLRTTASADRTTTNGRFGLCALSAGITPPSSFSAMTGKRRGRCSATYRL